jgi:hypothetical protein
MKSIWPLILAAGIIVAILFIILSKGKKAPNIPVDTIHLPITMQEDCVSCHAPGKQAPLKDTHPPKEQCFTCHKISKR